MSWYNARGCSPKIFPKQSVNLTDLECSASRLTVGPKSTQPLPTLRDLDQPYPFNITLSRQPLRLEFYDTASPTNWTLLDPKIVILCYSIASPDSLQRLQIHWKRQLEIHFGHDETLPVLLLGLQRDVRRETDYLPGRIEPGRTEEVVLPQTAMRVAAEMRCDRYLECSARNGDLCHEVFEDIAKTALATTTAAGGRSKNATCALM